MVTRVKSKHADVAPEGLCQFHYDYLVWPIASFRAICWQTSCSSHTPSFQASIPLAADQVKEYSLHRFAP